MNSKIINECGACGVKNDRKLCDKCWRKNYGDFDECYLCGEAGLCGDVCYCHIVWSVCPTCKVKQIKKGFGSLKCENGCKKVLVKIPKCSKCGEHQTRTDYSTPFPHTRKDVCVECDV